MRCDVPVDGATCSANTASAGCCGDSGANGAVGGWPRALRCASGDIYMGCYMDGAASGQFCGDTDGGCSGTATSAQSSINRAGARGAGAVLEYCYARGYTCDAVRASAGATTTTGRALLAKIQPPSCSPRAEEATAYPDWTAACGAPAVSPRCVADRGVSRNAICQLRARLHDTGCWGAGNSVTKPVSCNAMLCAEEGASC